MKQIKLLDCTLRDGGYVTNWTFGYKSNINIYTKLVESGVDIIEVGYIRKNEMPNMNRTSNPSVETFQFLTKIQFKKKPLLVAMIDLGACELNDICERNSSTVDGLRITFKKKDIACAMKFGSEIINKGYHLFLQPVSITDYSEQEYYELIQEVNKIKPYSFSIVDTYGLLLKDDLLRYYNIVEENLVVETSISYHAHNNYQLAFSNAIELINKSSSHHDLIIDSTVSGIGKDSGNTSTELLIYYLNHFYDTQYEISAILDIIQSEFININGRNYWGSFIGFISAISGCRTEYTIYLMKKNLKIKSILLILSYLDKNKKTAEFNTEHIEMLYREFMKSTTETMKEII